VIPIDREHRRSEATLGSDILTEVFIIVKQNHLGDGYNIISGFFSGGAGGERRHGQFLTM
jgi:hypothetical protein